MKINKVVETYLGTLGTTSSEIARTLNTKGIRGVRKSGCNCPIANLLKKDLALSAAEVTVNVSSAVVAGDRVEIPSVVGNFIRNFDAGYYPQLELFGSY